MIVLRSTLSKMDSSQQQVALLIRNPQSHRADCNISVPLDSTIAELKAILQQKYEGNPGPTEQTVCIAAATVLYRQKSSFQSFGAPSPPLTA